MTPDELHTARKDRHGLTLDKAAALTGVSRRKLWDYEQPGAEVPKIVARSFALIDLQEAARELLARFSEHTPNWALCEIVALEAAIEAAEKA